MDRYAGGDPEAFRKLYDRWEDRVYGFCLAYLEDEARAADAFQDTFRRLIQGRHRYEGRGRFQSWLFTLARRACVDQVRQARDEEPLRPSPGGRTGDRDRGLDGRTPAAGPGAEDRILRRQELQRLLSTLPAGQREALLLSKYEGFSYREIAEMTGSTEAAVKQKVYRALRRLRAILA